MHVKRVTGQNVKLMGPSGCKDVEPNGSCDGKECLNRKASYLDSCNSVTAPPSMPSSIASSLLRKDFMKEMAFSAT